jgi:hypothetical protein
MFKGEGTNEQRFMMKSEMVGWPSGMSDDLYNVLTKIFVKGGASQF